MAPRKRTSDESPDDSVVIVNKDLVDAPPARVTRRQFDRVWQHRGFTIDDTADAPTTGSKARDTAAAELAAAVKGDDLTTIEKEA